MLVVVKRFGRGWGKQRSVSQLRVDGSMETVTVSQTDSKAEQQEERRERGIEHEQG